MRDRRKYDLICFDVDGTLIRHPSDKVIWEILNLRFTGDDSVNRERYRMYLNGEIDYAEWVRLDVGGWIEAGATRDRVVDAVREFEVYEGALGDFTSHQPVTCSTGGAREHRVTPAPGGRYYLVVPTDGTVEGSYGLDSLDDERPASSGACHARQVGAVCPS